MRRLILATALLLSGCGSLPSQWVRADEATYKAVWPAYKKYFEADPELDKKQKESKRRLGRSWKARLEEGKRHDD